MPRLIHTTEHKCKLFRDMINEITHPKVLDSSYIDRFPLRQHILKRKSSLDKEMRLSAQLKDWDTVEKLMMERTTLENKMLKDILDLELALFYDTSWLVNTKTKKCGNDSLFATININPKVSGEKMKEIMDNMRKYAFKGKLKENKYCIEYASATDTHGKNTHAHWAFKTSYSKLRCGGVGVRDNYNSNDRSAKAYIQRFFQQHYPELNYDIRVEGSNYNNRLLYIEKDDEIKYGKYPEGTTNIKYISE